MFCMEINIVFGKRAVTVLQLFIRSNIRINHYLKMIKQDLNFNVNGENEIYSYTQSYLEDIQELSNPEKIIQPIKAIEVLYKNGELPPNSKITDSELGYYTFTRLSDTTQVLNPAWCFTVEGKGKLYVSAFEGEIITDLKQTTEKVME